MFKPLTTSFQLRTPGVAAAALVLTAVLAGCGQQTSSSQPANPSQPPRPVPESTQRAAELVKGRTVEDRQYEQEHAKKLNAINSERFEKKVRALQEKGVVAYVDSRAKALEALAKKGKTPEPSTRLHTCSQQKCVLVFGEVPAGTFSFKPAGVQIFTEGGRPLPGNPVQVRPY